MGIRTFLWGSFFFCTCIAALFNPIWGIVGYVGHYSVGPEGQWWAAPLNSLNLRYSFTLAICTAIGILMHMKKLQIGGSMLLGTEKLILVFLGIVWMCTIFAPESVGRYTGPVDHPSVKLTKTLLFVFMMTHVVTFTKNLDRLMAILSIGALVLGLQAWEKPYSAFVGGRLEGVGGPDFDDANRFGGYMAGMLFLMGAQFMRGDFFGRVLAVLSGGFTANAIVLSRSRGVFLGVIVGMITATAFTPRAYRTKVMFGLILATVGGLSLMDPQFISRVGSIGNSNEERDTSSKSRLEIWDGATKLALANPLGVGVGNFYQEIGNYAPKHPNRDAHSTVLRCLGETGFLGLAVFLMIIASTYRSLFRTINIATSIPSIEADRLMWAAFGSVTGLTAVLIYGLTGTLIYTEYLWWMIGIPICLERVLENVIIDTPEVLEDDEMQEDDELYGDAFDPDDLHVSGA